MEPNQTVLNLNPALVIALIVSLVALAIQVFYLAKAKRHIRALEYELRMLRMAKAMDEREIERLKLNIGELEFEIEQWKRKGKIA